MTTYLVTGIAGFIGSNIARALLAKGASVRGIDNFITGKRENLVDLQGIDFIEGTIEDPETCARVCHGVDFVFHEAALASVPRSVIDPVSSNSANVSGTLNVLVAARDARVRRVVYAGSSSAYGDQPTLPKRENMVPDPISPYAVSKLTGEYYMRSFTRVYGLETVTIRYFNVFGPHQDPCSQYSVVLAKFHSRCFRAPLPSFMAMALRAAILHTSKTSLTLTCAPCLPPLKKCRAESSTLQLNSASPLTTPSTVSANSPAMPAQSSTRQRARETSRTLWLTFRWLAPHSGMNPR